MQKNEIVKSLLNLNLGLKRGTIDFVAFNPEWDKAFKLIRGLITKFLSDIEIYHIGSTAIPKGIAKPIIDILIVFKEENYFKDKIIKFERLGFLYKGEYDILGRYFFAFYDEDNILDFIHIHAYKEGHEQIYKLLDFNKKLKCSPLLVDKYSILKHKIKDSGILRKEYSKAKEHFILSVLNLKSLTEDQYIN